ncbi:enoyl-CoA hydratase [Brevundimonas staleyi]|uniref:Enoyl-CoA hydratase n=1 Tax=Brevundimonas staleyi TaxID=74326 RepID=A0ABW0FMU3_9CAUL
MSTPVTMTRHGGVALVTLNRPEALNAMSRALREGLCAVFDEIDRDPEIGAVVLTGAGRAFCAGMDLKEWAAGSVATDPHESLHGAGNPSEAIERNAKPVVAAINGPCITGGLELALACDILIAGETARFADTHVRLGIYPGWGLSQKLPRLIGVSRAKEMSLTSSPIPADQALAWGLVNRVVPQEALLDTALEIARAIADQPREVAIQTRRLIDDGMKLDLAEALALEEQRCAELNTIRAEDVGARREALLQAGRASA